MTNLRSPRLPIATAVVVLIALSAGAAAGALPVPRAEQQRIVASFGRTWLPGFLPSGYVYSNWQSQPGSATVYGTSLIVTFGKHGSQLQWTVEDPRDPNGNGSYDACSKHPFQATIYWVGKRRIIYQSGNHGTDTTLCLSKFVAVIVWNGHTLPARTLARFVASAHAVG